jgi:hypothetical protein
MTEVRRKGYGAEKTSISQEQIENFNVSRKKINKQPKKEHIPEHQIENDIARLQSGNDIESQSHKHKVAFVDIRSIIDRFAMTQAREKAKEHLEKKSKWYSRWFVRQTEAGYIDKYFEEAREEILKNKNLLSEIEIRWLKKSSGKALNNGEEERQYEILDEVVESVFQEQLAWEKNIETKAGPEKRDVGSIAGLDAIVAELLADYVLGQNGVTSRKKFDQDVNDYVLHNPKFSEALGISPEQNTIYASNLFHIAEQYKSHLTEKLQIVENKFSPEDAEFVRNYLGRVINIDVTHAKMQADLYQTKSKGAMRIVEGAVNLTQSPYLKTLSGLPDGLKNKLATNPKLKRILDKTSGLVLGNPVLYAYLGNRVGYLASTGAASLAAKALFMGTAAMVGIGPGMVMVVGAGVGAGIYLGARAAVERFRDVNRREEESVLGLRGNEKVSIGSARDMAMRALELSEKNTPLTPEEKKEIVNYMATLKLQDTLGRNLLGAEAEEGAFYKTNFLAIQDLRKTLAEFWAAKGGEFGNEDDRLNQLNLFLAQAESEIIEKLKQTDTEVSKEIRNRGLKVGLVGAGMTIVAGVLAPGVGKLIKMAINKTQEALGGHAGFDVSKVTFTEEVWNTIKRQFKSEQGSDFNRLLFKGQNGSFGNIFEIPKNSGVDVIRVNENGLEYLTFSNKGQIVPGVKIPVDINGHVDQAVLNQACARMGWQVEKITQNIPSSGSGNNSELYQQVKAESLNGVDYTNVHTKGFLNNGTQNSDFNELRYYVNADENGNALISTDLLDKGSFRLNGDNLETPDLLNLIRQGKMRFVFLTKEGPLSFVMNEHQELIIPKGTKQYELLFDASGKIRNGIVSGTGIVEKGSNGELYIDWMNADNGNGSGLVSSGSSNIVAEGFRIKPPIVSQFEDPYQFIPVGYRREKDSDLDELRTNQAKKEEDIAREAEEKQRREQMEKIPPSERFALACQKLDSLRLINKMDEKEYAKICHEYILNEQQQVDLLEYAFARRGFTHEQIKALYHPAVAGGGSGDAHGGHDSHGVHKPEVKKVSAPEKSQKNKLLEKLAQLWREDLIHAQLPHESGPNRQGLSEINRRPSNGIHLEFSADDTLLKGRRLEETESLAEHVYQIIKAQGLDLNKYRTKVFNVKFIKTGEASIKDDPETGAVIFNVPAGTSAEYISKLILNKLKGNEATLVSRLKTIDSINEHDENKEPHLEFRYDPLIIERIRPGQLADKASKIQTSLRNLIETNPQAKALKHIGLVKLNFVTEDAPKKSTTDENGNLIVNLSFDSDPQASARIILRQMENVYELEEEKVDKSFLREFSENPLNNDPNVQFDMDLSIIKKLGTDEAKSYIAQIGRELVWQITDLKNESDGAHSDLISSKVFICKVSESGPYKGSVLDDYRWGVTLPAGLMGENAIRPIIKQQLKQIRDKYNSYIEQDLDEVEDSENQDEQQPGNNTPQVTDLNVHPRRRGKRKK